MFDLKRAAVTRLQKFVRRRATRNRFVELVEDVLGYVQLTRELRRAAAAKRLQLWWRRRKLRATWLELVDDVLGYLQLTRDLKDTRAAKERKEAAARATAATVITAHVRGFLAVSRAEQSAVAMFGGGKKAAPKKVRCTHSAHSVGVRMRDERDATEGQSLARA